MKDRTPCDSCFPTPRPGTYKKHGTAHGQQRFRCRMCGETFTLTANGKRRERLQEKLEQAQVLFASGASMQRIAAKLRVNKNTVTRWRTKRFGLGSIKDYRRL